MKALGKGKQIKGQLTESPGCGAHQSISFPGSGFYCYGDACKKPLPTVMNRHGGALPREKSGTTTFWMFKSTGR